MPPETVTDPLGDLLSRVGPLSIPGLALLVLWREARALLARLERLEQSHRRLVRAMRRRRPPRR